MSLADELREQIMGQVTGTREQVQKLRASRELAPRQRRHSISASDFETPQRGGGGLLRGIGSALIQGPVRLGKIIGARATDQIALNAQDAARRQMTRIVNEASLKFKRGEIGKDEYRAILRTTGSAFKAQGGRITEENKERFQTLGETAGAVGETLLELVTAGSLSLFKGAKGAQAGLKSFKLGKAVKTTKKIADATKLAKAARISKQLTGAGAISGGFGLTGALGGGETDIGELAKRTAIGTAIGVGTLGAGKILGAGSRRVKADRVALKSDALKKIKEGVAPTSLKGKTATEISDIVSATKQRLVGAIEKTKKVLPKRTAELKALRAAQDKIYNQVRKAELAKGASLDTARKRASKARAIKAKTVDKGLVKLKITANDKNILLHDMQDRLGDRQSFKFDNAAEALDDIIAGKEVQPGRLKNLEEGLELDLAKVIEGAETGLAKAGKKAADIGGFSRMLLTIGDLSRIGRQNFTVMARHPILGMRKSVESLKYWGVGRGKEEFNNRLAILKKHEDWGLAKEIGLDIEELGGSLKTRSEPFRTTIGENIPGLSNVKGASERQFVGLGNDVKWEMLQNSIKRYGRPKQAAEKAKKAYLKANPGDNVGARKAAAAEKEFNHSILKAEAERINTATGTGKIPDRLKKYENGLNAALFSPRLMASRLKYLNPYTYLRKDIPATVRANYAKDLGAMLTVGVGALKTAELMGAKVEWDPRSTSFGKAQFGNTRVELAGGFTPYIRYVAQFLTGTKKTEGGEIESTAGFGKDGRLGTVGRFARSKASPIVGAGVNIADAKTFIGEPTTGKNIGLNFIPLVLQDVFDAMTDEEATEMKTILTGAGAIAGVGVQTFGDEDKKRKKEANAYVRWLEKNGTAAEKAQFRLTGTKSSRYKANR